MAQIGKSTISVSVDGVPVPVIPNTVMYKKGFGTKTVRAVSLGGGVVDTVHTENVEEKVAEVKFEIPNTDIQIQIVTAWTTGLAAHTVVGVDVRGIPFNLVGASMTNEPEFNPTADGSTEIIFQGNPMPL